MNRPHAGSARVVQRLAIGRSSYAVALAPDGTATALARVVAR